MSDPHPAVPVARHRADLEALLGHAGVARIEVVAADRTAVGLRLATDLLADDDLPRFDASAMDGYAVRPAFADQRDYRVVADVAAGDAPVADLPSGAAARVMTGAALPPGTWAVVRVEDTDASPTGPAPLRVRLAHPATAGTDIRRRGEEVPTGTTVAPAGATVTPAVLALARSVAVTQIAVVAPPRLAVVATGSELAAPGTASAAGTIHESNSEMIAALAERAGYAVSRVERVGDDPDALRTRLVGLALDPDVDVVVTTGGVSQGAYEVVRQAAEVLGGFTFRHVAMQPGAPQGFGTVGTTPVVCLPGTPVGAFVGFCVLLRPALDAATGAPPLRTARGTYAGPTRRTRLGRTQYVSAVRAPDGSVGPAPGRHLLALAAADALIEVPEDVDELVAGDEVTVHPL